MQQILQHIQSPPYDKLSHHTSMQHSHAGQHAGYATIPLQTIHLVCIESFILVFQNQMKNISQWVDVIINTIIMLFIYKAILPVMRISNYNIWTSHDKKTPEMFQKQLKLQYGCCPNAKVQFLFLLSAPVGDVAHQEKTKEQERKAA